MVENITNLEIEIIRLYKNNYLKEIYIREMAKLLEKSHVTLLPHLKNLEKRNILISKISGKNKNYKLNMGNNLSKEYISMAEKQDTISIIKKEFFIKKIYDETLNLDLNGIMALFGSYASGTYNKKSDIDLFYIGSITENQKKSIKNMGRLYKKRIHLSVMNLNQFKKSLKENIIITKEIIKNHIILQNSDTFINSLWKYYNGKREFNMVF